MPDTYSVVNLGEVEDAAPGNGFGDHWEARVARTALDAQETGVTYFRLLPGKRSPFMHRHQSAEEIYLILSGTGRAKLDDEIIDVGALDAIRIPPGTARAFEAGDSGLEFIAFGPHRAGDGELVDDPWVK